MTLSSRGSGLSRNTTRVPKAFHATGEKFVMQRNEYEAQTFLEILKAKFEV